MSESALWATAREKLTPFGRFVRQENRCEPGQPDVLYCVRGSAGVIELKHAAGWPAKPDTPLHIPHLTLIQVTWMESWIAVMGAAHLLLQVDREYLMCSVEQARQLYHKRLTRAELCAGARVHQKNTFPTKNILSILMGRGIGTVTKENAI